MPEPFGGTCGKVAPWGAVCPLAPGHPLEHDWRLWHATVLNMRDYRVTKGHGRAVQLPPNTVRIDRQTRWGNPYIIGARVIYWKPAFPGDVGSTEHFDEPLTREWSLSLYSFRLVGMLAVRPDWLEPLRGQNLACWCAPLACHGDIIIARLYGEPT